ncbi:hypothetical protein D5F01_LYC04396 [Larimichthys crocea]|uniref:Uncharacterized protein n=1 Tax=Larimichthys crocea TaxID=215358 RepID=A0A6G0J1W2_LARCR|nr:hypothetical protein D5F01_LYC04396 [Larimichthys crocea]
MGNGPSQEDYDRSAYSCYQTASEHPSILPDVSIDESLLRYSGLDSNAVLQAQSNKLVSYVPQFIEKIGSMTPIPNAVGLGALVISMIIELCTDAAQTGSDSFSMIRRVFGEEKASAVRDTMTEYLRRHQTFINNNQRLREEIQRLEQQLSNHLTVFRNSLLHDGQMSTRGFKIWVNGASFHLQMLIHEARLNRQADSVNRIRTTTDLYLQDLNQLLEKYRTLEDIFSVKVVALVAGSVGMALYYIVIDKCERKHVRDSSHIGHSSQLNEAFMRLVVKDIRAALENHFINIRNNIDSLINQHGSFTLPRTA